MRHIKLNVSLPAHNRSIKCNDLRPYAQNILDHLLYRNCWLGYKSRRRTIKMSSITVFVGLLLVALPCAAGKYCDIFSLYTDMMHVCYQSEGKE